MKKGALIALVVSAFCIIGSFCMLDGRIFELRGALNYDGILSAPGRWTLETDYLEKQLLMVNLSGTLEDGMDNSMGRGTQCPEMSRCHGNLSTLHYCLEPKFNDPAKVTTVALQERDAGESSLAFEGRMFQVDDAYVSHRGYIFDDKILINHGGCKRADFLKHPAGRVIDSYVDGIVAVHDFSHNYYHLLGELLPGVFQARQFILGHPDAPLLVKQNTKIEMVLRVLRLEGLVKVVILNKSDGLVHLDHAHVPAKVDCFKAPHAVWREFRNFYFSRSVPEILGEQKPRVVDGLKIVVASRNTTRVIEGFDIMLEKLRARIDEKHLVVFKGDEGLDRAMETFSNATVFVGAHGAGLTNMMFMPDNGAVVEILPAQYHILCYKEMAAALGLEYHVIVGSGGRAKPLVVDLDQVVDKVVELATRFH